MNIGLRRRVFLLSLFLLGVARADTPDAGSVAPHVRETIEVKRNGLECSQKLVRYEETCILGNGAEEKTEGLKVKPAAAKKR